VYPVLRSSVRQVLAAHPDAQVALSKFSLTQRMVTRAQEAALKLLGGRLPPGFRRTMGTEDIRRPRMERGLAVWTARARRFYPTEAVRARGGALHDDLGGQWVLIYLDPVSDEPVCLYSDVAKPTRQGDTLAPNAVESVHGGFLYGKQGRPKPIHRPMQSVVCWYTFAFTFLDGDIYKA
jgi:hypothetical protein